MGLPEASFTRTGVALPFALDGERLQSSIASWRERPTAGHLGDVLAFSIDPALREKVREVSADALKRGAQITRSQRALMSELLGIPSPENEDDPRPERGVIQREIGALRALVRDNPRSPLALLDLAQFDLAFGKRDDAKRKIVSALAMSPNSRIALRTVARYYVHVRDEEQAHHIISRHPRTPGDPWLMASEVALSAMAGRPSKFAGRGLRFVKDKGASPADLSELAGALGGIDLEGGHVKRARDLFRVALQRPNDNVLAQSITDRKRLGIDIRSEQATGIYGSLAEPQTLVQWERRDTNQAEKFALQWHSEEPFSSRPIQFLTTLYAVQEKYEQGMRYARRGLLADPNDSSLLTNLAYLLACSGELDKAEMILRRPQSSRDARFESIVLATNGLISMTRGNFDLGDALYIQAATNLTRDVDDQTAAQCRAYHARSAYATRHPRAGEILDIALAAAAKAPSADASIILTQLGKTVSHAPGEPVARRLSQWVLDEATQSLIKKEGITAKGAPALIIATKKQR